MRAFLLFCLVAALPAMAQETTVALRLPAEGKVSFRGVANFDGAGGKGTPVLYPAPNLAGAIAAMIAHGAIVDSARRSREESVQEAADRVLAPYRGILDILTYRELLEIAAVRMSAPGAKQIVEASAKPASGLIVDSAVLFSMTQDTQAIVLDNAIVVRRPGEPEEKGVRVLVRIVSAPQSSPHWSDNDGKVLKEQAGALIAESFDVALAAMSAPAQVDAPHRTLRYRQGGEEKIERAQVVTASCDRMLLRNLRGWLMSVPVDCKQAPAEPAITK
jgi:hypothetical protein